MPGVLVAAVLGQPLVLRLHRESGASVRRMRNGLEHVLHKGPLPRLPSPLDLDVVLAVSQILAA